MQSKECKRNEKMSSQDEDEEEDYMSETILKTMTDTQESLTYSQKRQRQLHENKIKSTSKSLQVVAQETLEQGLATEIPSDNIGFKLLSKMGFKKGMSLGNSNTQIENQEKATQPIPIVIKSDKSGIGISKKRSFHQTQQQLDQDEAMDEQQRQDFRNEMNKKFEEKKLKEDVDKSRKVIEQMDMDKGLSRSEYWPLRLDVNDLGEFIFPEAKSKSYFEDWDLYSQLSTLVLYLRNHYKYCIWCGYRFDSEEELERECPGDARIDHEDQV